MDILDRIEYCGEAEVLWPLIRRAEEQHIFEGRTELRND